MSELVRRLSQGKHHVEVTLRPEKTIKALKESLERGFVHITFTKTRGGTELGVPLDRQRCMLTHADLNRGTGSIIIVGELTVDDVKVRCMAEIKLPEMVGIGRLEPLTQPAEAVA
jgi:hypothetical protein